MAEDFEPTLKYIVAKLKGGLGDELEAKKIAEEVVQGAGLDIRDGSYDTSEFIKICETMKKNRGYPRFIAGILIARAYMHKGESRHK